MKKTLPIVLTFGLLACHGCLRMPGMCSMKGMEEHEHKKEDTPAHAAEEKVFDPVCGMEINKNTAVTSEYKGTTYYFCSKTCKANFEKEPNKFVSE